MSDQYFSFNPHREEPRFEEKINLDSLFERKRQLNLTRLSVYQKILHRVHERIKHTARQKNSDDFCFYVVPEFMFGVPRYDVATCVAYIMEKLQDNGFVVKYTHPNLLFISWKHYIPAYQRDEIRKRTGYRIDGFGKVLNVDPQKASPSIEPSPVKTIWDIPSSASSNEAHQSNERKRVSFHEPNSGTALSSKNKRQFRDTKTYRPTGNLIYDEDVIQSIDKKLNVVDDVIDLDL